MFRILIIFHCLGLFNAALSQSLATHSLRKTPAAAAKGNDLWCYNCDTMEDGEICVDLTGNHSNLIKKCKLDEFICMVKRFSYTISTENSTSLPKMWSLQRQCTANCERGCIIIGERTKLYACTSCCENSLCNTGVGKALNMFSNVNKFLLGFSIVLCTVNIFI